jgi:hypothetical protein
MLSANPYRCDHRGSRAEARALPVLSLLVWFWRLEQQLIGGQTDDR